jgi:hypothetical protein
MISRQPSAVSPQLNDLSQRSGSNYHLPLTIPQSPISNFHTLSWPGLNAAFRAGRLPQPELKGRCAGGLAALNIAPGLTQLTRALVRAWLPWQGKTFDPGARRGDNVFTRDSLPLARVLWPFYRDYRDDTPGTYRAFPFRTFTGPGLADPDRQVLKIDYDLAANPRLTIRRVLDELVQVAPGEYLGKAHLHWWWGRWQTVAFFTLKG